MSALEIKDTDVEMSVDAPMSLDTPIQSLDDDASTSSSSSPPLLGPPMTAGDFKPSSGSPQSSEGKTDADRESKDAAAESLEDDPRISPDRTFKLISQENEKFEVPRKVLLMSNLVKTMMEGDKEESEIPVPNVRSIVLTKVLEYMKYHYDNPAREIEKPAKSSDMLDHVCQWDAAYMDVCNELIFDIILAANYMDIKDLLDLACLKVATMIKGKTAEQIRVAFSIVNDFTPEEEAAIIAENKWAEEC